MKPSMYNFIWPGDDGKLVLFNSFTAALVETPQIFRSLLETTRIDMGGLPDSRRRAVEKLAAGGFFVEDDVDEIAVLEAAVARLKSDARSLDLTIAPTLRCNFACVYCYEQDVEGEASRQGRNAVMTPEVQAKLLERLAHEFDRVERVNILWFGGEPLMGKGVVVDLSRRIIRLAEEKGVGYRAGMITNGYELDAETVRSLIECRISFAQVTLDGPPAVHDARRMLKKSGRPTFERVIEGIARLAESGIGVTVRVNADRANRDAALETPAILSRRGLRDVSITLGRVKPYTSGCLSVAGQCLSDREYADLDRQLQERASAAGLRAAPFQSYPTSVNVLCIARRPTPMVIDPDGEIYKCWNEIGVKDYRIGNIAEFDRRTTSEAEREARWTGWNIFSERRCRACRLLPTCLGGCAYGPVVKGEEAECTSWLYQVEDGVRARYAREKCLRASAAEAAQRA